MKVCTKRPILVNPDASYSYADATSSKEEISAVQTILNNIYSEKNRAAAAQGMPSGIRLLDVTGVWDARTDEGYKAEKARVDSELEKLKKTLFKVATYSTTKNTTADLKRLQSKTYYFTTDYTTKHGVVKKGDSLTGRLSSASKEPRIMFDFYEKIDPAKAEAGEGTFSIKQSDIKNFATDIAPEPPKEELSWWKKRTKMEKTLIISGLVLATSVIGYSIFRSVRKKQGLI
jgi:hypothetical protein